MQRSLALVALVVASLFIGVANAAAADFVVTSAGQGAYVINGQPNPTLNLTRGRTYTFDVTASASGHPFWIKTVRETGTADTFDTGVTNNGISPGLLTFAVPSNAPAELFYQCQYHEPMAGRLVIASAPATAVPAAGSVIVLTLAIGLLLLGAAAASGRVRRRVA